MQSTHKQTLDLLRIRYSFVVPHLISIICFLGQPAYSDGVVLYCTQYACTVQYILIGG